MTEKLRTLLDERASAVGHPVPDLVAIRGAGRRRRMRRRAVVAAGCLAVVAAIAGVATALPDGATPGADVDATDPATTGRAAAVAPTYATGTTIRALDGTVLIDVGRPFSAYVATPDGFVVADDQGRVFSVRDEVTDLGTTDARSLRLVADPASSLVGWVDPTGGDPRVVVADVRDGSTEVLDLDTDGMGTLSDERDPAYLYALDAGTAYVRDRSGALAVDVVTGERRELGTTANGFDVVGAHDGRIVFDTDDGLAIGPTLNRPEVRLDGDYSSLVVFSPDGRYLSLDADTATVVDATTGQPVRLDVGDGEFSVGWRWLDVDSLAVLTLEDSRVDVLDCTVPGGGCEVLRRGVTDLAALESGEFLLPSGLGTTE